MNVRNLVYVITLTAVAKYSYCYGIVKDDNWMEHECEMRDDCMYYDISNMRRYWLNPDYEMFFPKVGKLCPYFLPRKKEFKKIEFESPFD